MCCCVSLRCQDSDPGGDCSHWICFVSLLFSTEFVKLLSAAFHQYYEMAYLYHLCLPHLGLLAYINRQ